MSIEYLSNRLRIDGVVLLVRADEAAVHDLIRVVNSHEVTPLAALTQCSNHLLGGRFFHFLYTSRINHRTGWPRVGWNNLHHKNDTLDIEYGTSQHIIRPRNLISDV